jgi:hypothetical protein
VVAREDLFTLLHSLTHKEKALLAKSLQARSQTRGLYHLSEAILQQSAYDEGAIRKALHGQAQLKQLPVAKHALREAVLDFLDAVQPATIPRKVHRLTEQVRMLSKRGLDALALRILQRAKEAARANDQFQDVLELIRLEGRLLRNQITPDKAARLREIWLEEDQTLAHLNAESQLRRLHDQLFLLVNERVYVGGEAALERAEALAAHPLLQDNPLELPFSLKNIYHQAWSFIGLLRGDARLRNAHLAATLRNWEDHPARIHSDPERYTLNHIGYVESFLQLGDLAAARTQLLRLHELASGDDPNLASLAFYFVHYLELAYARSYGQPISGTDVAEATEAGLKAHAQTLGESVRLSLQMELALYYFLAGKASKCLLWLQAIIDAPLTGTRRDIRGFALVLRLLVHYEQGDEEWLGYELRSILRQRGREGLVLAQHVAQHLQRALARPPAERPAHLTKMGTDLAQLESAGPAIFGANEVRRWLRKMNA